MNIDTALLANALLDDAPTAKATTPATIDIGRWDDSTVQGLTDAIIAGADAAGVRLKGIRTDTWGFGKFGIQQDTSNSGKFHGVPVVMTMLADFDTAEFVLEPL
ncbi:hypothetical protein [Devosia sp.]|uniref:hypothetical protein n=1 Tax=Devosia sp. TaxID=1871048 RepID=UPI001ACC791A|nr:hypothetical protein [Devosia sp.]MBN9309962.1 hypothetical protein [Devosia sp.]